jgi:hypothetical protein
MAAVDVVSALQPVLEGGDFFFALDFAGIAFYVKCGFLSKQAAKAQLGQLAGSSSTCGLEPAALHPTVGAN